MENSFKSLINSAESVLIILPTKPYFDQVAAGLSLFLSLAGKKEVSVYSPSPMLVEFNRLVGVNKVTGELGNKNLVIKFSDYKASGIERVSYDIEDGQFRLTVIPKPSVTPPKKEQVTLSYSGLAADTVVLVGGANDSHFPALQAKEFAGAKLVHLGIRGLNLSAGHELISFARPASSISEVVADLIKQSEFNLDQDVATNLLLGIEQGSNKYSSADVSADTFQTVAELMRAGGKRVRSDDVSRQSFPPGAIPGEVPAAEEEAEETPAEWLEPKIYKGTTVS